MHLYEFYLQELYSVTTVDNTASTLAFPLAFWGRVAKKFGRTCEDSLKDKPNHRKTVLLHHPQLTILLETFRVVPFTQSTISSYQEKNYRTLKENDTA